MMGKTLEAHDKLIREIFEGSYQFEIPDYQHPHAWTTEQAEELFNGLVSAMQDARTSGTIKQCFLGSIVLIKNDREPKSSVVDGQPRLSTLTMLFAVLRAAMPDAAGDITDFLYKKGKGNERVPSDRLIAREEDADFFRTFIQEQPGGISRLVASTDKLEDSRLRFRENATWLRDKATALSNAERDALWKFLANDCSLLVISTPDLEAAYRIFSVLNNRGLDLAPHRHHQSGCAGLYPHHCRRCQKPRLRQRVEPGRARWGAMLSATCSATSARFTPSRSNKAAEQDGALRMAAGQAFYNTSDSTHEKRKASSAGQRLRDDFIDYPDGFSPGVQEILTQFKFRDQIQTLIDAHAPGYSSRTSRRWWQRKTKRTRSGASRYSHACRRGWQALSHPAFGGQRQEQHRRVAGLPVGRAQDRRRCDVGPVRLGRRHHRPSCAGYPDRLHISIPTSAPGCGRSGPGC